MNVTITSGGTTTVIEAAGVKELEALPGVVSAIISQVAKGEMLARKEQKESCKAAILEKSLQKSLHIARADKIAAYLADKSPTDAPEIAKGVEGDALFQGRGKGGCVHIVRRVLASDLRFERVSGQLVRLAEKGGAR